MTLAQKNLAFSIAEKAGLSRYKISVENRDSMSAPVSVEKPDWLPRPAAPEEVDYAFSYRYVDTRTNFTITFKSQLILSSPMTVAVMAIVAMQL